MIGLNKKDDVTERLLKALLLILVLLSVACSNTEQAGDDGLSTIVVSLPFAQIKRSYARAIESNNKTLPQEITKVIFKLLNTDNHELQQGVITAEDNSLSFNVASGIAFVISASAYAVEELIYSGSTEIEPLNVGEKRGASVSLTPQVSIAVNLKNPVGAQVISKAQVFLLEASVAGLLDSTLRYYVNDIEGGNEAVGTIDQNGKYTPPDNSDEELGSVILKIRPLVAPSIVEEVTLSFAPNNLQDCILDTAVLGACKLVP